MSDQPSPDPRVVQVAYDTRATPYRGYAVSASYLRAPHDQNALINIFKDGSIHRSFEYPAYRIYNIAAHFSEMVDNELDGGDDE